jgi:hypothetical protein
MNVLTDVLTPCHDSHMNTNTATQTIHADAIVVGNRVIAPGRTRPVEVFAQLDNAGGDYFEFAAFSTNGPCALRLHRSQTVELVLS